MISTVLLSIIILFLCSVLFTGCYRRYALSHNIVDIPNERSSHTIFKPRGGGVVFIALWLVYVIFVYLIGQISLLHAMLFVPSVAMIGIIGYWDDRKNLPARWRLLVQVVAAMIVIILLGDFPIITLANYKFALGVAGSILAVFMIVWSTNLYNFMDGIDGIAGVEALFVYGVGGWLLWFSDGYALAILAWGLAAAVAGFLCWNWPKAKIFMGDVGSAGLGFLIIPFALAGQKWYGMSVLIWLILYGVFWFDATVTLLRRIIAGERYYLAHRLHAYQRLHQSGWSHHQVLWAVIITNILLSILAIVTYRQPANDLWLTFIAVVCLTLLYIRVELIKPMY